MIKSKKSQVGTTMSWVVAVIVIFFIMLVFLALASQLAATKSLSLSNLFASKEQKYQEAEFTKSDLTNLLLTFLNTKTGRDSKETIYDLLAKANVNDETSSQRKNILNEMAAKFLESNFPAASYSSSISLTGSDGKTIVNGYSAYNYETSTPEAPEYYSDSYSLSVPIIPGNKLNLVVGVK